MRIQQRLAGGIGHGAVGRQPGIEQSAGFQRGFEASARVRGQLWMEIHESPQWRSGACGADVGCTGGRLGRNGILAGEEPCALVFQCRALLALRRTQPVQFRLPRSVAGQRRLPRRGQRHQRGVVTLGTRRPCRKLLQGSGGIELQLHQIRAVARPALGQRDAFTLGRKVRLLTLLQGFVEFSTRVALVRLGQPACRLPPVDFGMTLAQQCEILAALRYRGLQGLCARLQIGGRVGQCVGVQGQQRVGAQRCVETDGGSSLQ